LSFEAAYLEEARRIFERQKKQAERAMAQLSDQELFRQIDPESNSVAVIAKHIAGNMRSRWTDFLTSDGEKPWRDRDSEFIMDAGATRTQVMEWWEAGWKCLFDALDSLRPADLARAVTIRGEAHTLLQAINRQVDHYAHHVGQIVFLAKHLKGRDWKTLSIPRGQSARVVPYLRPKNFGRRGSSSRR
jgi:hypothetical protein